MCLYQKYIFFQYQNHLKRGKNRFQGVVQVELPYKTLIREGELSPPSNKSNSINHDFIGEILVGFLYPSALVIADPLGQAVWTKEFVQTLAVGK